MAKQFPALTPELKDFIGRQHIFFTASATADSRINLSPKGLGGFRITGDNEAVFLNLTGSADYWRERNMVSMDGLTTGMD